MDKAWLRQNMQNSIKQISAADQMQENNIIFDIRQKELFPKYTNRAIYISLSDEVDTKNIVQSILSSGKKCLLPIKEGADFFFTEITKDTKYQRNKLGILEPIHPQKSEYTPDAILVPGLAFTKQ